MSAVAFDTLKFVEKLENGGFSHAQAKATAEAFADATGEQLATKYDLREAITRLGADLRGEVARLAADLRGEIAAVKADVLLLKWMAGFNLAATMGVLFLLLRR